ncbi:hypothetical protein PZA11_005256 [Diplocarpon coronariae]
MVALHFCTGTGPGYFRNSRYADLADTKGFHSHLPDGPFYVDVSSPGQNTAPTGGTNRRHSRHGTSDVLFPLAHLADTLGQWSSLLGVSLAQNIPDSPQANYTKIVYGNGTELVGYEARGVVHTLPLFANVELEFFGIV